MLREHTYICWRSPPAFAGWTIFQVGDDGHKEAILCFDSYIDAAKMLRQLRHGHKAAQH
ncbi:MAG TPA: hypothetical protein VK558_17465 [Patescibacteria group bacterium]|nr:hypothetical protein [Patescibacteria group bacterium]